MGTQYFGIQQQLNDGIRGLHLNITQGALATDVSLCYPDCNAYNGGTLKDTLTIVKEWLDANQRDVVTIFLESALIRANPAAVLKAFADSGADKYVLPGKPAAWPTLQSMIGNRTTLVVFADDNALVAANTKGYFIPLPDIVLRLEGPFAYGTEWTCGPWARRYESILVIPHLIVQTATYNGRTYTDMPYPFNLGTTNGYQYEYHAVNCRGSQSIWVNFMEVDYYSEGDVFTPTLKLNALPYPNDDVSNFYPKFFDATVAIQGVSASTPALLLSTSRFVTLAVCLTLALVIDVLRI
ncbi:hypothetical protein GGI04_003261 [Coemansia thaxteri]|uniref:PLC-like phosphodiesterase n=1 Tax=Coemansia thaxteri TaxID=2663907 RepID=A0A9W8BI74_9FUNG|nr:hypothetical protein GGI04_003261 [Coemansia thaxteri]KAJ2004007.1 hypothetical protein H4R26_002746 [Coemansia thaxteri]KAJ2463580.1 hypothetical protein GGI02_005208 [Coemansia sp. RSA 2322]KAJ2484942.1 hypothetical protein EV174_002054 [Coemansia sp. RSA 2320]